jgi:hypothetical protein
VKYVVYRLKDAGEETKPLVKPNIFQLCSIEYRPQFLTPIPGCLGANVFPPSHSSDVQPLRTVCMYGMYRGFLKGDLQEFRKGKSIAAVHTSLGVSDSVPSPRRGQVTFLDASYMSCFPEYRD